MKEEEDFTRSARRDGEHGGEDSRRRGETEITEEEGVRGL